MSNQNLSNLDDKEFDSFLEDIIETPPSASIISEFTPWNHAMKYALLGLGFTSLTLNFLCLDMILPCIGYILMFLGFRTLRNENNWFKACYWLTNIKLVFWLITLFLDISVYFESFENSNLYQILLHIFIFLTLLLFIAVRNAIRGVQGKVGLEPHGGNGIVICYIIILVLGYLNFTSFSVFGLFIAYICGLRALYKLSKELNQAGYAIQTASVKTSNSIITIGYGFVILIILVLSYGMFHKYPMDWQPKTEIVQENTIEIREQLLSLGFPEEVLDDLTTDEILACDGAIDVIVDIEDYDVTRKRQLRITHIGVKFGEERERWKLIQHFEWLTDTNFCGTESIQLWPVNETVPQGWHVNSDFTGRVLYDSNNTTYTSEYHSLDYATYNYVGPFANMFGETSTDMFATFSFPSDGDNQRGYIMYDILETMDGVIVDSWFNYTHQKSQFQFPVQTAMEFTISHWGGRSYTFQEIQTALQFSTHEEEPKLLSEY